MAVVWPPRFVRGYAGKIETLLASVAVNIFVQFRVWLQGDYCCGCARFLLGLWQDFAAIGNFRYATLRTQVDLRGGE